MLNGILKRIGYDTTAKYHRVSVEIETIYNEKLTGQAYTRKPLIMKNHCHQNRISLTDIRSINLQSQHFTIPRLNSYRVASKNSDYCVELQGHIYLDTDGQTIDFDAHHLRTLKPVVLN